MPPTLRLRRDKFARETRAPQGLRDDLWGRRLACHPRDGRKRIPFELSGTRFIHGSGAIFSRRSCRRAFSHLSRSSCWWIDAHSATSPDCSCGKMAFNNRKSGNVDDRRFLAILSMKMGRIVIPIEHSNHDSIESAELRQRTRASASGTAPRVFSRSTRDKEHPDTSRCRLPTRFSREGRSSRSRRQLCLSTSQIRRSRPIQTDPPRPRFHRRTAATADNSDGAERQRGEVFGPCLSIAWRCQSDASGLPLLPCSRQQRY